MLACFFALGVVVALVPFFVTLSDYIPTVEKELSARLQESVSIDSMRASLRNRRGAVRKKA